MLVNVSYLMNSKSDEELIVTVPEVAVPSKSWSTTAVISYLEIKPEL